MLAGIDSQIDGNERQAVGANLEHQHKGMHLVVDWVFGVFGSDIDLGGPCAKLPLPQVLFLYSGWRGWRSRVCRLDDSAEATGAD